MAVLPCVLFEDDDLLVVDKPAGMNTHAPGIYAGEGIYEWLRNQERRWANLAIIHRLDKDTSGVLLFSKTTRANRSLTEQFAKRMVRKQYLLLTDRTIAPKEFTIASTLVRVGEKYASRSQTVRGEKAETRLKCLGTYQLLSGSIPFIAQSEKRVSAFKWLAEPLTGRTHQIRVHASENGIPILGDVLYGGTASARVYLHAAKLILRHPATNKEMSFDAPPDFELDPRIALREKLINPAITNAYRLIHGGSENWPKKYLDRFGDFVLLQSEDLGGLTSQDQFTRLLRNFPVRGKYHKVLRRRLRAVSRAETAPCLVSGEMAPAGFTIQENGLRYEVSFSEGYSTGLFLDQRDNRKRLLTGYIAPGFEIFSRGPNDTGELEHRKGQADFTLLNVFAYTCAFSVCAAKAGMKTTSVDLSSKYLEWGRRNFGLNDLALEGHRFLSGDAFDELKRFGRRGNKFDVIVLDPPTFSQSKKSGAFRVEKDYGKLIGLALPLLKSGGILFASTNYADWPVQEFLDQIKYRVNHLGKKIVQSHFAPQPPDFPISRAEPAYFKSIWMRIEPSAEVPLCANSA